jgi:peptide/nickel transport system permease protein
MAIFLVRRALAAVPVIFAVVLLVFLSLHLAPGDPVDFIIGPDTPFNMDRETYAAQVRERLGLDRPLSEQFMRYVSGLLQLDFGRSLRTNRSIFEELAPRYVATLELSVFALIMTILIGVPLGILAALRPNTWFDSLLTSVGLMGVSVPSFWLGLLLMLFFSLQLGWFPPSGRPVSALEPGGLQYLVLPGLTLALGSAALMMRLTRSQMLEVLGEDFIRTGRAKGLRERAVIMGHALRNALIPVVTVMGLQFGGLLAGTVVVETVFAFPGVGRYLIQAVNNRDFPAVQSGVLFVSLTFVAVNFLVDILYSLIDPRIRYE